MSTKPINWPHEAEHLRRAVQALEAQCADLKQQLQDVRAHIQALSVALAGDDQAQTQGGGGGGPVEPPR